MIRSFAASQLAKSAALCVCPVVGAGVVATQVPQVRKMVHKATAPKKPVRAARNLGTGVEKPCVPVSMASLATPAVPRVAQVLPAAVAPPVELSQLPTEAATAPPAAEGGAITPGNGVGSGGGSIIGPGGGGGFGPGGGGVVPAILPGTTPGGGGVIVPVIPGGGGGGGVTPGPIPEPAVWLQMMGGFLVVGASIRYGRRQRRLKAMA